MLRKVILALFCFAFCSQVALAQKVDEKTVPTSIRTAASKHLDGNVVSFWVLDKSRNKYVATVLTKTLFRTVEVSLAGKWIATTDALLESRLPPQVLKSLQDKYVSKGYESSNFQFIRDDTGTYYSAEVSSDDRDLFIILSENGQVLSEEER